MCYSMTCPHQDFEGECILRKGQIPCDEAPCREPEEETDEDNEEE